LNHKRHKSQVLASSVPFVVQKQPEMVYMVNRFKNQLLMKSLQKSLFLAFLLCSFALSAQFSVTIQVDQNIHCHGGNNGGLTAMVNPPGSAYTFAWSNGGTNASISDLAAGSYIVTVHSPTGSTATATAALAEPAELVATAITELPLAVNPTGTVEVETNGGTLPYAFQWVNQNNIPYSNQENLVDAPAGQYTLTVTDDLGCTTVLTPVTLTASSSTRELWSGGLNAYPNPAHTFLNIEIPEAADIPVQVFNALGQMTENRLLQGPVGTIPVHGWPDGAYTLVFPSLYKTARVVVKH